MKTGEQDRYGAVEKCRAVLAVWQVNALWEAAEAEQRNGWQ